LSTGWRCAAFRIPESRTLIKCVNALESVPERRDHLDGIKVPIRKPTCRSCGAGRHGVFSHFELFPHCGLSEISGLRKEKVLAASMMKQWAKARKAAGLSASSSPRKKSGELSGGQPAAVAIAAGAGE